MILNHTHSANYNIEDIPEEPRNIIIEQLANFKEHMVKRGQNYDKRALRRIERQQRLNHYDNDGGNYNNFNGQILETKSNLRHRHYNHEKHEQHPAAEEAPFQPEQDHRHDHHHRMLLQQGGIEDIPDMEDAAIHVLPPDPNEFTDAKALLSEKSKLVQFGWKAPVSMLLLPFLREVFGPIKFLHVVRDGRDIALSRNMSPVKKFYKSFYGNDGLPAELPSSTDPTNSNNTDVMNVLAMQLWNDWNLQVLEYEKKHGTNANDFDYLVMRTEDLLNPETKFQSLQQLADFVGSPMSLSDICCQSQQAIVDMGESSVGAGAKGRHGGKHRHHLYDQLLERRHHHDDNNKNMDGEEHHDQHEEDVALFHEVIADHATRHRGGIMGSDPILGNMHRSGGAREDIGGGRGAMQEEEHLHFPPDSHGFEQVHGWHHGHMNGEKIKAGAHQNRVDHMQHRNHRFQGIARRVAAVQKTRHQQQTPTARNHLHHEQPPLQQQQHDEHHQKGGLHHKEFVDTIAAHHQARQNLEGGGHNRQIEHDPLLAHDPMRQPKQHDRGSKFGQYEPNIRTRQKHDEAPRRRLLSSFNKLQVRHAPHARKHAQKQTESNQQDGHESVKEHRKFRPGLPETKATKPASSSSWSLASLEEYLGLSAFKSSLDPATMAPSNSAFDQAILDQFEHMPLLPIGTAEAFEKRRHRHHHQEHQDGHDDGADNKTTDVTARYGKWVSYLNDKPELSRQLHDLGAECLKTFGYEPAANFLDVSGVDDAFQCDSTVVCQEESKKWEPWKATNRKH